MTLASDPLSGGSNLQLPEIHGNQGIFSTSLTDRETRRLSAQSKCVIIASVVGGVAGIVIIGLGAANMFGAGAAFIGSVAGGGVLTAFSGSVIIWIALSNCKRRNHVELEQLNHAQPTNDHNLDINPSAGELHGISDLETIADNPYELEANDIATLEAFKNKFHETGNISEALQIIPESFFENKSQERAKTVFSWVMRELLDGTVFFPQAGPCNLDKTHSFWTKLDPEVFQLSYTEGVEKDLPNSSKDTQRRHLWEAASQYNAAEAASAYTPAVGRAMVSSNGDPTQGPKAQRTNPSAFECVTAFLTHLGFNMLEKVLPSAGHTYQGNAPIEHGYLRPTNGNIKTLTQEFKENFSQAEYVCYSSFSHDWEGGSQPVYIMLQAAPAIGYSYGLTASSDNLQKFAALANYLAFFRAGISLAQSQNRPFVLHATAVGGGVFGNKGENLEWGFVRAALALQEEMKLANVSVQLEVRKSGGGILKAIAQKYGIPTKARIGGV